MKKFALKLFALALAFSLFTEVFPIHTSLAAEAKPDLIFTAATVTQRTSSKITYSYTIKNNGTATIDNLYNVCIQNFYSSNTIFNDSNDVAAGGSILGVNRSLAPGQTYTGTFYSLVSVPTGMNYLTFKIDWSQSVSELNENNNTRALSLLADLAFTNVTITSKTSNQVNYTYTIKNIGGNTVPNLYNVSIQNFYSANTVFNDTGDVASGGSILAINRSLAPGETYTGTFAAYGSIPSTARYVTGKIDWGNIVTETSEYNNTFARLIP